MQPTSACGRRDSPQPASPSKLPDVPSCLVLDIRLPDPSGLDFQSTLVQENIHIPIIFMTGHGESKPAADPLFSIVLIFLGMFETSQADDCPAAELGRRGILISWPGKISLGSSMTSRFASAMRGHILPSP